MNVYEAFIVVPKNVDRDAFVKNCLNNNECAVGTPDGIFRIAKDASSLINDNDGILSTLDFPDDYKSVGSKVIVLELPFYNEPLVFLTGNVNNRFKPDEEKQIKMFKKSKTSSVFLELRGLKGIININAISEDESGAKVNLEALNKNGNSEINIKSNNLNFHSDLLSQVVTNTYELIIKNELTQDNSTSFFYKLGEGLKIIDEWLNELIQNEVELRLNHKEKVVIGNSDNEVQPILLGKVTIDWLNNFLTDLDDTYKTLTVPTPLGLSGTPINAPALTTKIESYKQQLDSLKSVYGFIEK